MIGNPMAERMMEYDDGWAQGFAFAVMCVQMERDNSSPTRAKVLQRLIEKMMQAEASSRKSKG